MTHHWRRGQPSEHQNDYIISHKVLSLSNRLGDYTLDELSKDLKSLQASASDAVSS